MAAQGRYESTAVDLRTWYAGWKVSAWDTLQARKDFKTLVLTAFFGYFLPLLAESTPSETKQEVRCEGVLRIATGAERPRNDKFFGKKCGVRRHTWVPPYSFLVGQGPRALPGSGTDSGGGVRAPHPTGAW